MPIVINGSGTVTGLAVGGLPDGTVDRDTLAAAAKGSILQIVNANTATSAVSTSQTWADTGLTANITPSSTSSKILVHSILNGCHNNEASTNQMQLQLLRDSSVIHIFATEVGHNNGALAHHGFGVGGATSHLDSPSTTSQITYKIQFRKRLAASKTVTVQYASSYSYLTLFEVAG